MNTTDIDAALKMLDARGGALDKEAAKLIRRLQGEARLNAAIAAMPMRPYDDNAQELDAAWCELAGLLPVSEQGDEHGPLPLITLASKIRDKARDLDKRITALEDQKAAADGWKPRFRDRDGAHIAWAEYDLCAAKDLLLKALGRHDGEPVRTVGEGEVHTLASEMRTTHETLKTEHRGALTELSEVSGKLGRILREHEGDFSDTDTAYLLADEAAMEISMLRCQNAEKQARIDGLALRYGDPERGIVDACIPRPVMGLTISKSRELHDERAAMLAEIAEKDARIDKLMARQQGLMNAVVDAQLERGAFAPDHPNRLHPSTGGPAIQSAPLTAVPVGGMGQVFVTADGGAPTFQFDGHNSTHIGPMRKVNLETEDVRAKNAHGISIINNEAWAREEDIVPRGHGDAAGLEVAPHPDPTAELRRDIKAAVQKVMDEPIREKSKQAFGEWFNDRKAECFFKAVTEPSGDGRGTLGDQLRDLIQVRDDSV